MKPVIQRELDELQRQVDDLRRRISALSNFDASPLSSSINSAITALSGTVDAEFVSLSGTVDARFISLSGSVDSAWKAGDASLSGTVNARFVNLSGTINAKFVNLSGSVDSAWKAGDSALWSSLQTGATASLNVLSGSVDGHFNQLSGTLDAQRVWDGLDPLRGTRNFDDFFTEYGSPTSTSGGGTVTRVSSAVGHPGITRFTVATSASYATAWITDVNSAGIVTFGGGPIEYEACMQIGALDNGTNDTCRRAGFFGFDAGAPANGAWLELSRSRFGDNEFRFITAATGSRVQQKTGVTAAIVRWYRLRVDISPDGDAATGSIFCSGALVGQVATKTFVPTGNVTRTGIMAIKMLGAGSTTTDADYHYYQQTFTGSRI